MISKKAIIKDRYYKNIQFTNTAREGWELILKSLDISSKILLPSYIGVTDREGSGIYDPVIATGISHNFYLLNNDLSISIEEIERCLKAGKYDLILLVHYFGYKIKNIKEVVALCKNYNVIVVEDCAHFYNYNISHSSDVGVYGDFVFYSLHKFFPFETGGLFIRNNIDLKKPDVSELIINEDYSLKIMSYNIDEIVKKRIQNFIIYDNLLLNVKGVKKIKKMIKGDIPHNFPILIEDGLREKLYFWLIEKDITLIALYYQLIEPLQDEKFASMQDLSKNILNLPIHQDIDKKDIIHIVEMIKQGIIDLSK